jgi:integrase
MAATTVNRALESMGYGTVEVTAHDFRATASTRLHEMGVRSDFIELQLAHVERDCAKAAYNHADHLAERTAMMQAWADWLDGVAAAAKARHS